MALHSVGGAEPKRPRLRVNASFTACGEAHDQAWCAAALAGSGHFPDRGVRFDELAHSKAVVEVSPTARHGFVGCGAVSRSRSTSYERRH